MEGKTPYKDVYNAGEDMTDEEIRVEALRAASELYQGTGDKLYDEAIEREFMCRVKRFEHYIREGK